MKIKPVHQYRIPTLFFLVSSIVTSVAIAQVVVDPAVIVLHEGGGSGRFTLASSESRDVSISLSIPSPAQSATGAPSNSLTPYLRLKECSIVLRPGETRTVAVEALVPDTLMQGEYAGVVRVSWKSAVDGGAETDIERVVRILLRIGDIYADVKLGKIGAVREEGEVRFAVDLLQLGNAGYRGNMRMEVKNAKGKIVHSLQRRIDVFESERIIVAIRSEAMPPGKYKAVLNFDAERPDLGADALLILPKKYTVDLNMP
jgi:hypothetical protein